MPDWADTAIILSVRPHGENSALVTVLTRDYGRRAGLVRGGQSKSMRGVLQPGNGVTVEWRARLESQLGTLKAELAAPRASVVMDDPLRLAGLASLCTIVEGCVPEREPCPEVFNATETLAGLMAGDAIDEAWLAGYVQWEVAMLSVAGYALDLGRCAVTGEREGLAFVSPRTGAAVTPAGAGVHKPKLLILPRVLGGIDPEGGTGDEKTVEQDLMDGMELTRHFLEEKVFGLHHQPLPPARERFMELARRRLLPSENGAGDGTVEDAPGGDQP